MSENSAFEIRVATLMLDLRSMADELENILLEVEMSKIPAKPEQHPYSPPAYFPEFELPINIKELLEGKNVVFDKSPKNIVNLRDYAFIDVTNKVGKAIAFTWTSASTSLKTITQVDMDSSVRDLIEPGNTYLVHMKRYSGKKKYKWDFAKRMDRIDGCNMSHKLARWYAELKADGLI